MERMKWGWLLVLELVVALMMVVPARAGSLFGEEWEKFFKERVTFAGFVENTTGLATGEGDKHFHTSNPLDMQRFTILPEFNVNMDAIKLFISWKFVKEIRYSSETKSRKDVVSYFPTAKVKPLSNTFYDEYSPIPWEAVLDYNPTGRLNIRWGRQFISWGETDGLRLLDVINPQDGTFAPPAAPNLFNLDETRIPSWGLRMMYTVQPVSNSILEFFALPGSLDRADQRVDEIVGSNDTADRKVRYGRWSAHPETRMTLLGFNAFGNALASPLGVVPIVIPVVTRELPESSDSWKIGARITRSIGKLNLGLGYIWGFNPQAADMVFRVKGTKCAAGVPPLCSPAPGVFTPTVADVRLVNDRTHIFAGHFNYTVEQLLDIPFNTAIRGEVAFYPNKPYNISSFPGAFGLRAGPHPKHPDGTTDKHTLRYAIGFDRSVLIPFLQEDPWRTFVMSFQLFQSIILDHEDGIRPFSTVEKIKPVSTLLTFRVNTGYFGDTILPDLFVGYDPEGYWLANPALSYVPPGNEKIKITLVGALYGGRNKFKSLGLFDEKDSVFLKMRYQF